MGDPASPLPDVVFIVSASRSGSSCVADWLRRTSTAFHLQGELEPLLRSVGAVSKRPLEEAESDLDVSLGGGRREAALCALREAVGRPVPGAEPLDPESFGRTVHVALVRQWPSEEIGLDTIQSATDEVFRSQGWVRVRDFDPWIFMLRLLRILRPMHPRLDPYCYDIPDALVAAHFPDLPASPDEPDAACDEDRPFIVPQPWAAAGADALNRGTVLLKGPSNSYRLPRLRALCGEGRIRVLHVVRAPASTVNGLIDGWLHRSFCSRRVTRRLEFQRSANGAHWRQHWWCFDVPPGWERFTSAPLPDVCAHQWSSANSWILDHARSSDAAYHRLRFEDFLSADRAGYLARRDVLDWIRPGDGSVAAARPGGRPVMATATPLPGRWHTRKDLIEAVLERASIKELKAELGCAEPLQVRCSG